jgi:hypothetical protein
MHTTTTGRRGRTARGLLAVALATAATTSGALGSANPASAANMPDWAADFLAAGDAFEGGGGGGGGGSWWPSQLHPDTVSGGSDGVPTTCTSKPTPDGEELECTPSYPATPIPPARPTPGYGVDPGIGGPGGKGLSNRDGGDSGCTASTNTRGTRPPTEYEKKLYNLDPTQMMRQEHDEWKAHSEWLDRAWQNTPEGKAAEEAFQRAMQTAPGSAERDQAMDDWFDKLEKAKTTPEWKAWRNHLDNEPVPYTPPLSC